MNKEQYIDILNTLYLRIMRLNFSYRFIFAVVLSPSMEADYPDYCWCLSVSFATDAYTTITSLITDGNYSFRKISRNDKALQVALEKAQDEINKALPDFRDIRNTMFCHMVKKQQPDSINNMFTAYWNIHEILCNLHADFLKHLGISEDDIKHYSPETIEAIDDEINRISDLIRKGSMAQFHEHLNDIMAGKE